MKAGSAILSKYISVEILPQEPPSPSFACYDEEVDISMIYANPKDDCYKKAVELHDYGDAPALMFEMNGEGKFIYLEFFHAPCIPTPELKWDDSRKILCCQVKFHKINKKFYRNVKAYTLPDYSLVRYKLTDETKLRYISPCPNLILEVNSKDILCGFVIRDIIRDPGYKLQKQWAKETGYTYPQTFPGIDRTRKVFFSNW